MKGRPLRVGDGLRHRLRGAVAVGASMKGRPIKSGEPATLGITDKCMVVDGPSLDEGPSLKRRRLGAEPRTRRRRRRCDLDEGPSPKQTARSTTDGPLSPGPASMKAARWPATAPQPGS